MRESSGSNAPIKPIISRFYGGIPCWMNNGVLVLFLLCSGVVHAQSPAEAAPLRLEEAVQLSLQQHPELATFAYRREALQGRVTEAGFGQRPQMSLEVEDAFGSGQLEGVDNAQTTLTITWFLDGALTDARADAARAAISQVDAEREIHALNVAAHTATLFIENLAQQARSQLADEALQQAERALAAAGRRVRAGKASDIERLQAEAMLSQRQLEREDLTHQLKASRYLLAAQWGGGTLYQPEGDLRVLPIVGDFEQQLHAMKQNPMLQVLATQQRIAESEIVLARIDAKPRWQISTGVRRVEALEDYALVAGLSLPFGKDRRSEGRIQSLRAEQAEYAARATALENQIDSQLYVLLLEIEHSQHVIQALSEDIIPTLEKAQREAAVAYERGLLNYQQWHGVREQWLAARQALIDAFEAIHLQHIELQRLTGASLNR